MGHPNSGITWAPINSMVCMTLSWGTLQPEGARIERLGQHGQADAFDVDLVVAHAVAFAERLTHDRRG